MTTKTLPEIPSHCFRCEGPIVIGEAVTLFPEGLAHAVCSSDFVVKIRRAVEEYGEKLNFQMCYDDRDLGIANVTSNVGPTLVDED